MTDDRDDFRRAAGGDAPGFLRELLSFMRHNKKWWLLPVVIALLILGGLALLSGSGAAPFVYTVY